MNDKKQRQTAIAFLGGGTTTEGPMVDGLPQGQWIFTHTDGKIEKGPYVNGVKQGQWTIILPNSRISECPVVDGKAQSHIRTAELKKA